MGMETSNISTSYLVIQLTFLWFVPESPRRLVSKNRVTEARALLAKNHAGGDVKSTLIGVEMEVITIALEMENESKTSKFSDLIAARVIGKELLLL